MVDLGVWQHLRGVRPGPEYAREDLLDVHRGAMAEQFVGQEMAASQRGDLYYWSREARGSSAEVDYLAVVDGDIYGVEVKSGPPGRLRSLAALLDGYPNCKGGLALSAAPYAQDPKSRITHVPLYFAYSATRSASPL